MAAPGIGIGDLVNACAFIYDLCVKYKDAPKEFDEIADKAKSLAVVLERIRAEAKRCGNLVERAGPQGYSQLEHHLRGLDSDCTKLSALVTKYARIHDEGPGRRLIFTIKESSSLTDLRRRIGLHEQMLEMWYMTLIYGSLRRLEGGQENLQASQRDILSAIEAIKNWTPQKQNRVRSAVRGGDSKPLEQELCKAGLDKEQVKSALGAAVEYVDGTPREQVRMESRAKSSTVRKPEGWGGGGGEGEEFGFGDKFGERYNGMYWPPPPFDMRGAEIRRRKSTGERPKPRHRSSYEDDEDYAYDHGYDDDDDDEGEGGGFHRILLTKKKDASSSSRRRKSDAPSKDNDLLAVPTPGKSKHHHRRSHSQQLPFQDTFEEIVIVRDTPPPAPPGPSSLSPQLHRHRSHSRSRSPHPESELSVVEHSPRRRRDSSTHSARSTHSYTRERGSGENGKGGEVSRRRSSSSRGRHGKEPENDERGAGAVVDRRRIVTRMDRIDSIPVDGAGEGK